MAGSQGGTHRWHDRGVDSLSLGCPLRGNHHCCALGGKLGIRENRTHRMRQRCHGRRIAARHKRMHGNPSCNTVVIRHGWDIGVDHSITECRISVRFNTRPPLVRRFIAGDTPFNARLNDHYACGEAPLNDPFCRATNTRPLVAPLVLVAHVALSAVF